MHGATTTRKYERSFHIVARKMDSFCRIAHLGVGGDIIRLSPLGIVPQERHGTGFLFAKPR